MLTTNRTISPCVTVGVTFKTIPTDSYLMLVLMVSAPTVDWKVPVGTGICSETLISASWLFVVNMLGAARMRVLLSVVSALSTAWNSVSVMVAKNPVGTDSSVGVDKPKPVPMSPV